MHLSEILVNELNKFRAQHEIGDIDIVETGTIRGADETYRINDGWSTLTFAQYTADHGGSVTSIDLSTTVAREVLSGTVYSSSVDLIQGHSIDVLSKLLADTYSRSKKSTRCINGKQVDFFDVAFLDSDNDAQLIFHEFLIVKKMMRSPGLIMVDDVDMESSETVKGHALVPYLISENIPHRLVTRDSDSYSTGVLVIGA